MVPLWGQGWLLHTPTKFETDALSRAPFQPFIWVRYINDIFMIWTRSVLDLNTFTFFLNDIHTTMKFTGDYSFTSYPFSMSTSHFTMAKSSLPLHHTYRQTPILTTFVLSSHTLQTCYSFRSSS